MDGQSKRSKARLGLRLRAEECEAISSRARRAGLTVSEYVRRRSLEYTIGPIISIDVGELKLLHTQLKRIGGNINQIARAVNTLHHPEQELPALKETLDELGECMELINDILEEVRNSI
jgi:hypothetical protein